MTALEVANFFLSLVDDEAGDSLSNLKLQKLLYYAQGFHLALYGKPLFDDPIEAWVHGPVVPTLYRRYKGFGAGPISPPPDGIDPSGYPKDVQDLLLEVYDVYGQYSAAKLRNMTHEEPPWVEAYDQSFPTTEISHDSMTRYFKTLVNG